MTYVRLARQTGSVPGYLAAPQSGPCQAEPQDTGLVLTEGRVGVAAGEG